MRLTRLQIKVFRGIESLDLDLDQPVIVLVGVNGSGKTTVLDAIANGLQGTPPLARELRGGGPNVFRFDGSIGETKFTDASGRPNGIASILSRANEVAVQYPVNRHAIDTTYSAAPEIPGADSGFSDPVNFSEFFRWFREVENFENQERRSKPGYSDPQLDAVRRAVEGILPGYRNPRVLRPRDPSRERAVFAVNKGDVQLSFDQFSEGERALVALVADIARRAALTDHDPPLEAPGVVLIDEIDLHLHPGWQREVLPRLTATFPNMQFITTTHSPVVVASVPSASIRALKDFKLVDTVKTQDRDPNSILEELFGVSPRPDGIQSELREVAKLIDEDKLADARQRLDALTQKLGEDDDDVHHLSSLIQLLAG